MTTQTDVLASNPLTATGQLQEATATSNIGRARIKALYILCAAAGGSLVFRDGGASGAVRMTINTVAGVTIFEYVGPFPGEGVLFNTNVHVTLTNVTSVTAFYG